MIKSKKQSFIVIGVFTLVLMLVTTTYAFFNYTRTGTANTIRTGRIYFNTSQSNTLNLTNVFPMSASDAANANLDEVSLRIWGDTTYADGEEYEITIMGVNNTIGSGQNAKTIPISYIASYSATPVQEGDPNIIGESSDSYFTARGSTTAVYELSTTGEATNGEQVLIGYIPSGATGIDGTLTIKAYLDVANVVISDTYPEEETDTNNDGYIDGTPASFGEGKIVLTTTEWNSLQNTETSLSFKIKAVSQEGTWVERQIPTAAEYLLLNVQTLETTSYGKIYSGANPNNYVIFNDEQWRIIGVYEDSENGNMLKIIKSTPSTTYQNYNSSYSYGNAWSGSTLQSTYLYDTYYQTLSSTAREMIKDNAVWNVGSVAFNSNASTAYTSATATTWIGKIGIISVYEYLYGAENDGTCWSQAGNIFDGYGGSTVCKAKDWLYGLLTNNGSLSSYTLNPYPSDSKSAMYVHSTGIITDSNVEHNDAISPVVYLKSNVAIIGGTGEPGGNEYTLYYSEN